MVVLLFMAGMAQHAGCSRTLSVQEQTEIDAVGVQEERGIPGPGLRDAIYGKPFV